MNIENDAFNIHTQLDNHYNTISGQNTNIKGYLTLKRVKNIKGARESGMYLHALAGNLWDETLFVLITQCP